ncbi:MAG: SDR family oxidoreductase [Terriglobia bacterium]|jgi:NAD(P)-dependent dehydrogenase (short-subunit alcohol dehydrogenase family)
MPTQKVALITGAYKGLGFEIARQLARQGLHVVIGARDLAKARAAADKIAAEGGAASAVELDVNDAAEIEAVAKRFDTQFGKIDVLVNNAGVFLDQGVAPSALSEETLRQTFDANFFGPFAVTRAFIPLLKKSEAGRIVNVSSTLGSLTVSGDPNSPFYGVNSLAYQSSKAALNALTVLFAKALNGTAVKVNSACPGWVRTDMGGEAAPLSVEQGADTPVWLATLDNGGPTGGFFNSRQPVAW